MSKIIYKGVRGKMVKVRNNGNPDRENFVIQWKGRDWSGFRTLAACEEQFPDIEKHPQMEMFTVVEK